MLACTHKTFINAKYGDILYDYEVLGYTYKEITLADKIIDYHKELLKELKINRIQMLTDKDTNDIMKAVETIENRHKEEIKSYYTMRDIENKIEDYQFTGTCRYCGRKLLDGGYTWECVCGYGFTKGFNELELSMYMDD